MKEHFPKTTPEILGWQWDKIEPFYKQLTAVQLNAGNIDSWLQDWSDLADYTFDQYSRLYVATTVNTEDEAAQTGLKTYLETTFVKAPVYEQQLKEMLLASGLEPAGLEIPIRNMRAEADLYREENLELLAEEQKLNTEYDKLNGARTVMWEGEERTLPQMHPILVEESDRDKREKAWRLVRDRVLEDREATHDLWRKYFDLRVKIAANADKESYREYAWQQKLRFAYTPADSKTFTDAIEKVVVPAVQRLMDRRKAQMGLDSIRHWDMYIDPLSRPALKPIDTMDEFIEGTARIFDKVDSRLSRHYHAMMENDLLDLDNRKGKAPGGYCTIYPVNREPFIFMNAVGLHDDMQTLLHEAGHAFHVYESGRMPYQMQSMNSPMEFNEVASMAMELLAAPYLEASGLYTSAEAARARIEHLEGVITFWPYMALVVAFQHWIYENPDEGRDPEKCDIKWSELWDRFMPFIDYSGMEDYKPAQWHRQLHIHQMPFYYIEYGLAQLGAVQVWGNALENQAKAVEDYLKALSLGCTVTLPELFETAGAKFAFDATTLNKYVDLIEEQIEILEAV